MALDRVHATHGLNSQSSVIRVTAPDRDEPLITSGEVARRLGVTTSTVSAWARQGLISPAVRTAGGRLRFRWSQVQAQLRERGTGPAPD